MTTTVPNEYEEEWESKLKGDQFALKGVYFQDLNERLTLKVAAGITYTDYSTRFSHSESWEQDIPNAPDWEYERTLEAGKKHTDAWGGIISVGVDFVVAPSVSKNITLGVEASHAADKYNDLTAAYINLGWTF